MTEDPRISEIRAVLDENRYGPHISGVNAELSKLDSICAILDHPAPAPRVFFPGYPVPAGVAVISDFTLVRPQATSWQPISPCVEVTLPSPEEWQAAVDKAREERSDASGDNG